MYTHYINICNHLKSTIEIALGRKYHQQKSFHKKEKDEVGLGEGNTSKIGR
jgi:hypothetical protein